MQRKSMLLVCELVNSHSIKNQNDLLFGFMYHEKPTYFSFQIHPSGSMEIPSTFITKGKSLVLQNALDAVSVSQKAGLVTISGKVHFSLV